MSYIFFEDVLKELGHKLAYDAIVNYAGNSFAKDSWEMIQDSNPMTLNENGGRSSRQNKQMMDFLGGARVATKEDIAKMNAVRDQAVNTKKE